jgi:signal transduction histidine kinase
MRAPGVSQKVGSVASPAEAQGKRRALVVDDNPSAREVLTKLLLAEGFECDAVSSGDEALARVAEGARASATYDAIFADLVMPGMDGLGLTRRIRAADESAAIVIVTGSDDMSSAHEALRLGADEYVVKPYSMSHLRMAWEQAFERRRQFVERKLVERACCEAMELVFHDLRNPLTAARGYLSLMQACPDNVGPCDIAAAARGCDLAVDIIEQGEELSRIERREAEVHERSLRLDEIVTAVVESLRPLAEGSARRIQLAHADDLPAVLADASLARKVASALVADAVKYASGEADILVELSASNDRSEVFLAVTDDGLAVPPQFREAIFDRQRQGELKRAGSRRGRGLALPFAREACRQMWARIWVENAGAAGPQATKEEAGQPGLAFAGERAETGCRFVVAFRAASTSDVKLARETSPASQEGVLQHE